MNMMSSMVVAFLFMVKLASAGTTYYVDSVTGHDANSGTSEAVAWRSVTNVNNTVFSPGDRILFKAGTSYAGQLKLKGNGTSENPILVGMYGSGDLPVIDGVGNVDAVRLYNISYWVVQDLEIKNTSSTRGKHSGVFVFALNKTITSIELRDLYIHDVDGWTNPASGDCAGIFIFADPTSGDANIHNLLIENCRLERTDCNGILVNNFLNSKRSDWHPMTNLVVRGNQIEDVAANGIYVLGAESPLVEYNIVKDGGQRCSGAAVGIWPYGCDDAVIQFNEVSGMACELDGQGFDSDINNRNALFQYNYSHDNRGGFMLLCTPSTTADNIGNIGTVVRYNISQNDGVANRWVFSIWGPVENASIYNNTIYNSSNVSTLVRYAPNQQASEDICFRNNIFYADGTGTVGGFIYTNTLNQVFENNVFYGSHGSPSFESGAMTEDPQLVNPGGGGDGLDTLAGYKITNSASPCIFAGTDPGIDDADYVNGNRDFWGNRVLLYGIPDVGAYSYYRPFEFLASDGFSSTQAGNGWSYACVHYSGTGDLYSNQVSAVWESSTAQWRATIPGITSVYIDSTSQDFRAGNAVHSLRCWTADRDYVSVGVEGTLEATVNCGARLYRVDAATHTTTLLLTKWATAGLSVNVDANLTDIREGDQLYFMLQSDGSGSGSGVMQEWNPLITADPDVMEITQASEDFSSAQGSNGWYYACVHYTGVDDLYSNQQSAVWVSADSEWKASVPSVGAVYIDSDSQDFRIGNAVNSIRYWVADRDYQILQVDSTLITTDDCGARLYWVDAATQATTHLMTKWATAGQSYDIDMELSDVKAGDRICFMLQQSAGSTSSNVMQQWDPLISGAAD